MTGVRWRTRRSRLRTIPAAASLSSLLTATHRIVGRCAACAIASAPARSFVWRFTQGVTQAGGIRRTSCPSRPL